MQNNKIVIKVLNDLLQESYFELTEDKIYTVGSSDECDIFINVDVATAFSLSYVGENLLFHFINDLLDWSEDIICGENYALPKIFKINNIDIGIGKIEELPHPDVQEELNEAADDELLTETETDDLTVAETDEQLGAEADNLLITENEQEAQIAASESLTKPKTLFHRYLSKLKLWQIILIIVLIVIVFFATILVIVKKTPNSSNVIQISPEQSILKLRKTIVTNPAFNGLHIVRQKAKKLATIIGIVETDKDLLQLRNILRDPIYRQVTVDVLVFDKIKDKITLLATNDGAESTIHISFNYEKGFVQITGFSNNINSLTDLGFKLKMLFPNIGDIDYSNLFELDTLVDDINSNIESFTMPSQINTTFDWKNNYILIQGYLDNDKISPFITSFDQLVTKYNSLIHFKFNLTSSSNLISTKINQIHLGQPNYILVNNGDVVFEGGQLESYVLTKITKDRLYFSGKINFSVNVNTQLDKANQTTPVQHANPSQKYKQVSQSNLDSRTSILLEEAAKESDTISKYEYQVVALNKMYSNTNDNKLKENIQEQIGFINSELTGLKHEHSTLLKEINNNVK